MKVLPLPKLIRCCLLLALCVGGSALASVPPTNCGGGVVVYAPATCPPVNTPTSQPGVTGNTVSGTVTDLGNTISNVLGGAFGGGGTAGGLGTGGTTGVAPGGARTALQSDETGAAAAAGKARWNIWAALSQANVGYSFQPLQSSGKVGVSLAGLDYTFGNDVVLGVAISDERTRIDTPYNGGKLNANGNTVAPYLGWRLSPNWMFDASVGFGRTDLNFTDNSLAGGIRGANKDKRTFASMGLAYSRAMGNWLLTGKGTLLTSQDRFSSFTMSNSVFVDASSSRTSQLRLGGQAMYNAGAVIPFVGLTYVNDIERPNQAPVNGQSAANDRDGWQVRAGLNIPSRGALYGSVSLTSEIGRRQVKNDQILFNLGVRF